MEILFVTIYLVCFVLMTGGAVAMIWSNIKSINEKVSKPSRFSHPEAPEEGEEVMYVDLSREKLENLYND